MPRVVLGNPMPVFNGRITPDPSAITMVHVPDCKSIEHALRDIGHDDGTANGGLWWSVSGLAAPTWVSCDENPELEAAIAARFGCPAGRPSN